jgi:hypothetical protein
LPHKEDTASPDSGCTNGCTSIDATANAGTVEALAAALLTLSATDRARLAALLTAGPVPTPSDANGSSEATGRPAGNAEGPKAT